MSAAPRQRRAAERVQGLLIMLPWLAERQRVSIHEMANTFSLSVEELSQDLTLAGLCGTPPYSPLELIEIFFDENEVWVEIPNVFNKPLRLSVAEAFALRAVADTALALPGGANSAALGSAIRKLNELTAIDDALVIENPHDPLLAELAHFCDINARVSLDYFSPTTNKSTSRSVVPRRVWLSGEHWYLDAIDLGINEPRVFRVDRITALTDTGEVVNIETLPALADEPGFHWDAQAERVTLHLQPSAHWVAERYPVYSQRKLADGVLEVVLPVTSAPWLGRLLVRAGNAAVVVSPEKYAGLGADTAASILARYS